MCVDILWYLGQPGFTWRIAHNFHAFTPRQPGSTRVSRRVPWVGEVWKGWPGCRVNASRKLLVAPGWLSTRVGLSARVNPSTNNFLLAFTRQPGQPFHTSPTRGTRVDPGWRGVKASKLCAILHVNPGWPKNHKISTHIHIKWSYTHD